MKALLAIPAMLIAMNAAADCPAQRPTELPAVPAVATATEADMAAAQLATKAYVESVDRFLSCREGHLSSLEHNFFVAEAHSAAERYNQALRDFQQRESIAKS